MSLEKTKIVRGSLLYMLGNNTYIDRPSNCYQLGMYYDRENNITYIKMKRVTYVIEILCSLIIVTCILTNIFYDSKSVVIECTQVATYSDSKLFLNLRNSEESEFSIYCQLYVDGSLIEERYLNSGDLWVSSEILNCPNDCYVKIIYDSPLIQPVETMRISVVDWSR